MDPQAPVHAQGSVEVFCKTWGGEIRKATHRFLGPIYISAGQQLAPANKYLEESQRQIVKIHSEIVDSRLNFLAVSVQHSAEPIAFICFF